VSVATLHLPPRFKPLRDLLKLFDDVT